MQFSIKNTCQRPEKNLIRQNCTCNFTAISGTRPRNGLPKILHENCPSRSTNSQACYFSPECEKMINHEPPVLPPPVPAGPPHCTKIEKGNKKKSVEYEALNRTFDQIYCNLYPTTLEMRCVDPVLNSLAARE